jgi:hypothetical protein
VCTNDVTYLSPVPTNVCPLELHDVRNSYYACKGGAVVFYLSATKPILPDSKIA